MLVHHEIEKVDCCDEATMWHQGDWTAMSLNAPKITNKTLDPALIKRQFPGLRATSLHYLDSAATAQMPRVVLDALRRFEIHARANVHDRRHAALKRERRRSRPPSALELRSTGCNHLIGQQFTCMN
jgi:hypothetical protein